jgi:hypothetical protein
LPDWLVSLAGVPKSMNKHAQRLVASSSGVCLLLGDAETTASDFAVGRAMQSVWLELTSGGFAAQPMMSLPVLKNLQANATDLLRSGDADKIARGEASIRQCAQTA